MIALFAVAAFALLLVAAFVIDVGNWQEHRRHLQVQADNGAKSTGIWFTNCLLDPVGSEREHHAARRASTPATRSSRHVRRATATPYNLQVDDPDRVVLNLNRADYPPLSTPGVSGVDFDPTFAYSDDDPDTLVDTKPARARPIALVRAKDRQVPRSSAASCLAPRNSSTFAPRLASRSTRSS